MTLILKKYSTFASQIKNAEVAQLVEHQLPKLRVEGSNPFFRSTKSATYRDCLSKWFFICTKICTTKYLKSIGIILRYIQLVYVSSYFFLKYGTPPLKLLYLII